MRKLNVRDAFKAAAIIRKAKLRDDLMKLAAEGDKNVEKLGLNAIMLILEKAPEVEQELYEFFGDVSGSGAENIATMELNEFKALLLEIAKENDLKGFFAQAAGSLT